MRTREVYPNATAILVALEIRHPVAVLNRANQTKLKDLLREVAPIMRTGQVVTGTSLIGPGIDPPAPRAEIQTFPRFFSRDNRIAMSFRPDAVVVETTRYEGWRWFRELTERALTARGTASRIDGIERVGVRFINEIRVPGEATPEWASWVDASLLGPTRVVEQLDLRATQSQGVTAYESRLGHALVLRYGPRNGFAVDPTGDLRRSVPSDGPFFLLDLDSFWMQVDETPQFDVEQLLRTCDHLHDPVDDLFELLITERLRTEVLRRAD